MTDPGPDPEILFDGPENAPTLLVLAHGAGAPMDSPFMTRFARKISAAGIRVARFEFPYMRARRVTGARKAPDRPQVLRQAWLDAIARLGGGEAVVVGGKSLGGRVASMVADEVRARGLLCLGYPFHPPGQPDRLRTAHLETLATPALFLQGTRDAFGNRQEVEAYRLSPAIRLHWLEDGDHSWKPRAGSGRTESDNVEEGIAEALRFLGNLKGADSRREGS